MNHEDIVGSIFIPPNNTMKAKYVLYAIEDSDILSDVYVKAIESSEIDSGIYIRVEENSGIDSVIDIKYAGANDILASIQPVGNNNIESEIYVPPHNRMTAIYEVQEPPKLTDVLEPIQDSFTREKFEYQTINYGKNSTLAVGRSADDYFRSYIQFSLEDWNPAYVILDSKIRLYYSGIISDDTELELFNLNEEWQETGITHLNRPYPTSLIVDEFTRNKEEKYVEFTVTSTVLDWISNSESNNGFIVRPKNEAMSNLISFKSRESSTPPELRILYYDNRIYSAGRSQTLSDIFVWHARDSDIDSEIEVNAVIGNSDIDTTLYVHQVDVPVESDIHSEIFVSKPKIEGEITVFALRDSDIDSSIAVRLPEVDVIDSEIMISKPLVSSEIFVKYQDYINSEITVELDKDSDMLSEILVIRETISGDIYVKYADSILSDLYVRAIYDTDIYSSIAVSKPYINSDITVVMSEDSEVLSDLYVKHRDDIDAELAVRAKDEDDIEADIYVKYRDDIDGSIHIRAIDDSELDADIYVKHSSDIESQIAITRDFVLSEIYVAELSDIDTEIYVKYRDDLPSEIDIKIPNDIPSEIDIMAVSQIYSEIAVTRPDIYGEIMIPYWDDSDISSTIQARLLRVSNINSAIRVSKRASGYVFII